MAGAGKKTFTAGEVLTASDVNTYLMEQSVMVFGGTAARSSAIPTPSEGMTTYRTDTNQIESYDGSAWRGMSGLQLIKTQEIGTGVSSVTVTDAFSATYDNYKIVVTGGSPSANCLYSMQIGGVTSGYTYQFIYSTYGSTGLASSGSNGGGASYLYLGAGTASNGTSIDVNIGSPFLSKITTFNNFYTEMNAGGISGSCTGFLNTTASYTSFSIFPNVGTMTGGTIAVYGYAK